MNIHEYYKPKTISCGSEKITSGHIPTFESKYNKLYTTEKIKPIKQFIPVPVARLSYPSSITSWPYPNNDWADVHNYHKSFHSPSSTTSGRTYDI